MSKKKNIVRGDSVIRNRMGRGALVIKSDKLSLPWEDRYVIVDIADQTNVLDDCCGYGYPSRKQAVSIWLKNESAGNSADLGSQRTDGNNHRHVSLQRRQQQVYDREAQIRNWLARNPYIKRELLGLIDFSRSNHLRVTAADIDEVLAQNEVKTGQFTAEELYAALQNSSAQERRRVSRAC